MAWKFNSLTSVSHQIAQRLRTEIVNGRYAGGEQFPTVRALAYEAAVNPNTMQKALALLEDEGLIEARGTVGRFVTSDALVIEQARNSIREKFMEDALKRALELGISKEMFINYIKESEGCE